MSRQQERQQSVRAVTGTAYNYEGDWMALFDDAGIASGTFNDRLLAWINDRLDTSYQFLPDAQRALAVSEGVTAWDELGTFDASSFTPLDLFGSSEPGVWYEPFDLATVFQDTAATSPVTAVGQSVARINDKSGNAAHATQSTSGSRPLWQSSGGLSYLDFNGSSHFLQTPTIDFSGTNKMTIVVGITKDSDAARGVVSELTTGAGTNVGACLLTAPDNPAANYGTFVNGGAVCGGIHTTFAAPITNIVTARYDMSQATAALTTRLRVNQGSTTFTLANAGPAGAGNFANDATYIGARAGTSVFLNGRIYFYLKIGRLLTDDEADDIERYANRYTGAF